MLSSLLLLVALEGAPAAAAVQAPPPPPPPRGAPMWVQRPSADDLSRHFPDAAVKAGVAGRVAMSCRALVTGALTACSVLSESPAGYGFGEAALRLSPLFRLASRMSDGASVEGITLRLPIVFRMAEPPPPQ